MGAESERVAQFGRLEDRLLQAEEWYRWGEDGLAGFCDIYQRLCSVVVLKNLRPPDIPGGR